MKYFIKIAIAFWMIILFSNNTMAQVEKKVIVKDLSVNVEVIGSLAFTRYEMTIYNPNARQMENQLTLPMSPGEEVVNYYLDINGSMRSAVVVDKDKARETFEEIVNRRVDPGLIEKVEGNNYRLRVYPVPAQGVRKTIIVTQQQLPVSGNDYVYSLTGGLDTRYERFSLSVDVYKDFVKPKIKSGGLNNFAFAKGANRYSASVEKSDFTYAQPLVFTIPLSSTVESLTVPATAGKSWFYAVLPPMKFEGKNIGKPLTVVWDNSLSGLKRNKEAEIAFLEDYLTHTNPSSIRLCTFNSKLSAPIEMGSPGKLVERIKAMVYDGRSDMSVLASLDNSVGNVLLFSDGMSSLGEKCGRLSADVVAVTSGSSCDFDALNALGARHIDLNTTQIKDAVDKACSNVTKIKNIKVLEGKLIDMSVEKGDIIDGMNAICGKMAGSAIRLSIELTNDKSFEVIAKGSAVGTDNGVNMLLSDVDKQAYELDLHSPFPFERLMVTQKIKRLTAEGEVKNKAKIVKLATEAGLVTRYTSLLVLEDISDYVQYEITPPKELQTTEYFVLLKGHQAFKANVEKEDTTRDNIVTNDFESYYKGVIDWWKRLDRKKAQRMDAESVEVMGADIADLRIVVTTVEPEAEKVFDIAESVMPAYNSYQPSSPAVQQNVIKLKAYSPDEPYVKILEKASQDKLYETYLMLREGYLYQPMFYIDVADVLLKKGMKQLSEQVLGNIIEISNENSQMVQNYGHKLVEYQMFPDAIKVFEYLVTLRPEHPQPLRDLALALEYNAQYQKALDTFNSILTRRWSRFDNIKPIVFVELNSLIARQKARLDVSKIKQKLIFAMPVDNRVAISWGTDNCDIDLHVKEPGGEVCFYSHRYTASGGRCSDDFTNGFGPEEYMIRKAIAGEYKIMVNNYANHTQGQAMPVVIYADVFANYGSSTQVRKRIVVRVENVYGDLFDIGTFKKQ